MTTHKVTTNKTYLFNNVEVKLTGRFTRKTKMSRQQTKEIMLYEVQPADSFNGDWKKWASIEELHEIFNMDNINE